MAISDINPEFITAAPVSKAEMRQQLTYIKDALTALDDVKGYQRLSGTTLVATAASIMVPLPTGYDRYIVEWINVRGVADGTLQCRMSSDGVSTVYSGGSDYVGGAIDYNSTGVSAANPGGSAAILSGATQDEASAGSMGRMYFSHQRNQFTFECSTIRTDAVRQMRQGFVTTAGTNNLGIQFFITGGAVNLQIASSFSVLACE